MYDGLAEFLTEILVVAGYASIALVLALVGLLVEYSTLSMALSGDLFLALWTGGFGVIALWAAFLVFTQRLLPLLRRPAPA
jgi:hypothetical protein